MRTPPLCEGHLFWSVVDLSRLIYLLSLCLAPATVIPHSLLLSCSCRQLPECQEQATGQRRETAHHFPHPLPLRNPWSSTDEYFNSFPMVLYCSISVATIEKIRKTISIRDVTFSFLCLSFCTWRLMRAGMEGQWEGECNYI